ncbi:MAG: hypothetical protein K0Q97_1042 [Bacillota bacterium]|jgi:hypothetical protein|nr:hypothetical protein [Bacillota bacterium]
MKSGFIYFLAATTMLSFNTIGDHNNYEEINSIEYLLNERVAVINEYLFDSDENGEKDIKTLTENLYKIESDDLLQNDLAIMKRIAENPSDYELVSNVQVNKIYSIEKEENEIEINADLDWAMSGYDGEFNVVKNYDIKCAEKNGKIYLTDLDIIEYK